MKKSYNEFDFTTSYLENCRYYGIDPYNVDNKDDQLKLVRIKATYLENIPDACEEVQLEAVKTSATAILYAQNITEEMIIIACSKCPALVPTYQKGELYTYDIFLEILEQTQQGPAVLLYNDKFDIEEHALLGVLDKNWHEAPVCHSLLLKYSTITRSEYFRKEFKKLKMKNGPLLQSDNK